MKSDRFFSWDLWTAAWSLAASLCLWSGATRTQNPVLFLVRVERNLIAETTGWEMSYWGFTFLFWVQESPQTKELAALLKGLEPMGETTLPLFVDMSSGSFPLLCLTSFHLSVQAWQKVIQIKPCWCAQAQLPYVLYLITGMHRKKKG